MSKMMQQNWIRLCLICCLSAVFVQSVALASDTTGGIISIQNEGDLRITFGSGEITFVTEEGGSAAISSTQGDTLYGTVDIAIVDTRADGERTPYSISLRLNSPTYGDHYIDASNIVFTNVSGLPTGLQSVDLSAPVSAAEETRLLETGDTPPAINEPVTVTVQVQMHVPAGTVPGTYTGNVFLTQHGPELPSQ